MPGGGRHLVFQELLGLKRSAMALYTGAGKDAAPHAVLQRPWKRRLVDDLGFGPAHQLFET